MASVVQLRWRRLLLTTTNTTSAGRTTMTPSYQHSGTVYYLLYCTVLTDYHDTILSTFRYSLLPAVLYSTYRLPWHHPINIQVQFTTCCTLQYLQTTMTPSYQHSGTVYYLLYSTVLTEYHDTILSTFRYSLLPAVLYSSYRLPWHHPINNQVQFTTCCTLQFLQTTMTPSYQHSGTVYYLLYRTVLTDYQDTILSTFRYSLLPAVQYSRYYLLYCIVHLGTAFYLLYCKVHLGIVYYLLYCTLYSTLESFYFLLYCVIHTVYYLHTILYILFSTCYKYNAVHTVS